ncbi:ion transporter [Leptolyngbya sp. FACHB-261]|nr:ion transporter [Leptolyngbya sp. FACHB-261]
MIGLIILNILAFTFETVDSVALNNRTYFNDFESFSAIIFTIEYGLRLWTCDLIQPKFRAPVLGRLKFAMTPMAIVDFISILPYWLFFFFHDLVFIKWIHFLRLARLLKIGRYSESMRTLGHVLQAKGGDLLTALFMVFLLLVISSSAIYYTERVAQPDIFSSIPASMWWSVITLTSVGYGDAYPVTPLGRLIGGMIAVLGLGLVALPTGILASGYTDEIRKKRMQQRSNCPHCGADLNSKPASHSVSLPEHHEASNGRS